MNAIAIIATTNNGLSAATYRSQEEALYALLASTPNYGTIAYEQQMERLRRSVNAMLKDSRKRRQQVAQSQPKAINV